MLRLVALVCTLALTGFSFSAQKFACVDTNRILQESKLVADAQKELREKLIEFQKKLSKKEQRLEELKKQIESKAISKQAKEEKIKEYQTVESEARELQTKAQKELNDMKQRFENMVYNRVKEAAEKLSKERNYSGVMDCGVFIYKDTELDITTDVIRLVDKDASKR